MHIERLSSISPVLARRCATRTLGRRAMGRGSVDASISSVCVTSVRSMPCPSHTCVATSAVSASASASGSSTDRASRNASSASCSAAGRSPRDASAVERHIWIELRTSADVASSRSAWVRTSTARRSSSRTTRASPQPEERLRQIRPGRSDRHDGLEERERRVVVAGEQAVLGGRTAQAAHVGDPVGQA